VRAIIKPRAVSFGGEGKVGRLPESPSLAASVTHIFLFSPQGNIGEYALLQYTIQYPLKHAPPPSLIDLALRTVEALSLAGGGRSSGQEGRGEA
jgi:hypothetical protein